MLTLARTQAIVILAGTAKKYFKFFCLYEIFFIYSTKNACAKIEGVNYISNQVITLKLKKLILGGLIVLSTLLIGIPVHAASHMRTPIDYRKSSETVAYPNINQLSNPWIKVKISKNRAYIMDGHRVAYTMYCSAGQYENKNGHRVSATPTGTYAIENERGATFYNPAAKSGGNNYVSWHDHGTYLFHSVPIDKNGHYIKSQAKLLGKKPASHGCVRLSIPDSKYMMQMPVGTKVVIEK